ncbi:MAG: serine hydrolase domain-containing protein, partial [Acidimicrobiia bacterium]
ADRAGGVSNQLDTRFGIASGAKGFTALAVMRLVESGRLSLASTARSILGTDLPLIDAAVTVEHLLTHTSGIGDYIDDGDFDEWSLAVAPSELDSTDAYLTVLDGHPQRRAAGTVFEYCNGAFVVLALIAQRVSGVRFDRLVDDTVIRPAGLTATGFLRLDALPPDAAVGYLDDGATNIAHVPVLGSGDGGIFTTAADMARLWSVCAAGSVVSPETFAEMIRPRQDAPADSSRYGLGFWLDATRPVVRLDGCDAGVSFRSRYEPATGVVATVVSNSTDGAWPVARAVAEHLDA